MFNPSREQVRQFFREAYRRHRERLPLAGLDAVAVDLIARHPEYHTVLAQDSSLMEEYAPERGEMNPFLHLSLHLAVAEQLSIDQPPGIRAAFERLATLHDRHAAEHILLDALGVTLFDAQASGKPLDPTAYLEAVRRAGSAD